MKPSVAERFWSKVNKAGGPDSCWEWTASVTVHGYGEFSINGKLKKAHRVAWAMAVGEVAGWLFVCHKCDNRKCCNPSHLFLGTHRDNMDDRQAKGRTPRGEQNGCARLTSVAVSGVRRRLAEGRSQSQVAAEFGTTRSNVSLIARGLAWRSAP